MLTFQEKYDAILRKDASYEGVFVTAVKTTGIFCRPVCTARKPKPENVVFYNSAREAILHGYRPCYVCKPMQPAAQTPAFVEALIEEINQHPEQRIRDGDLRKRGVAPSQLRRWFKKNHQMSFHAFQRMLRINHAFARINQGDNVTATAFDTGFQSLSGFNDSFRDIIGGPPTLSRGKTVIHINRFTTPLGPMFACATSQGICLLEFTDRRMLERELQDLKKRLNAVILPGENVHVRAVKQEMTEYFEGKRKHFTVSLHTPGTPFQQSVWQQLQQIGYGAVRSYKEIAAALGSPLAVRAVGNANGSNRVAVIIPCHRVIADNGGLVGYGGGVHRKRWLLDFERANCGS